MNHWSTWRSYFFGLIFFANQSACDACSYANDLTTVGSEYSEDSASDLPIWYQVCFVAAYAVCWWQCKTCEAKSNEDWSLLYQWSSCLPQSRAGSKLTLSAAERRLQEAFMGAWEVRRVLTTRALGNVACVRKPDCGAYYDDETGIGQPEGEFGHGRLNQDWIRRFRQLSAFAFSLASSTCSILLNLVHCILKADLPHWFWWSTC